MACFAPSVSSHSSDERLKNLLCDLGKPTRRGVRKCPKCGTANGTRGINCKNKLCDVVFREVDTNRRRPVSQDAVKITTNNSNCQTFSVRLRDRGPDYRGFVQVCVQDIDSELDSLQSVIQFPNATGICYIDNCLKGSPKGPCQHISTALNCCTEAESLPLKDEVVAMLPITEDMKHSVWVLARETLGPLVQRVSKQVMVVKCKEHSKHPLGYLHTTFFNDGGKKVKGKQVEHWFHCSCRSYKSSKQFPNADEAIRRCIHFYACICAFACDEKLSQEFAFFITLDITMSIPNSFVELVEAPSNLDPEDTALPNLVSEDDSDFGILPAPSKKSRKEDPSSLYNNVPDNGSGKKSVPKKASLSGPKKYVPEPSTPIDETQASISFHDWLASVTERINETMHYQFPGNPDPLVFHVPQVFFDCLQRRISAGTKKKRLPNTVTGFVRKDAVPLGTFYRYTWHIHNILQVKQIFDTPQMPLELSRSFVENSDGTYEPYTVPDVAPTEVQRTKGDKQPLIKPMEKKTFLKVGNMFPEQKVPNTFEIEWIPNLLSRTKIGEMRVKFEYGHIRNQTVEQRHSNTSVAQIHNAV